MKTAQQINSPKTGALEIRQTETRLASFPPKDEVARIPSFDIESIFKLAIEKEGTAETLEKLMGIRREINAELSKKAFDEALAAFQAECPVIEKRKAVMNKDGRAVRYKYAPLDDIVAQVRDLLQKHGFSYSITSPSAQANRVTAICKLTHRAGHSHPSEFSVPIDPQAFMNEQQKFASALTFAKRYAFCNSLGILTGDEDTDGRTESQKPAGPSTTAPAQISVKDLATKLWILLKPVRGEKKDWEAANQWLWQHEILDAGNPDDVCPNLSAKRFEAVIAAVTKKIAEAGV